MMIIKAEPVEGCSIYEAYDDAKDLADRLKCSVKFEHNGVTCLAHPYGDTHVGVYTYHEVLNKMREISVNF